MKRIEYIDRARAFGMFLVYYGHLVEKLAMDAGIGSAQLQWRLIYSFHMPFFFFLSGVFWHPTPFSRELFHNKIKTRLVPSIFLSLLLFPLWILFDSPGLWKSLTRGAYLSGKPINFVLWFVICLMAVEFLAAWIVTYLKSDPFRLLVYALVSFCFGYFVLINLNNRVTAMTGIDPRSWFISNAFVALLFYILGYLSREVLVKLNEAKGWLFSLIAVPVFAVLFWLVFNSNPDDGVVVMVALQYGNIWYFPVIALLGIAFLLVASRLFSVDFPLFRFIGQNTIIYLGLNGIGFIFMDSWILSHLPWLPARQVELLVFATVYTSVTLLLYTPVAWGIRRWFPEPAGLSWSPTSVLPPMQEWGQSRAAIAARAWLQRYLLRSDL
jgi:fucose 4-O-acetylase-like acetyltransferase